MSRALCRELTETLGQWGRSFEVVLVDDGSTDETFELLSRLHREDPRLRVIRLRRNFGQTAAFAAGFARARGRLIVTADGDLQNDLRDIPRMIDKLEEGYDIVCGWRKARKDPWLSRRLPSLIANALISWATGVRLHDYGCSLKVFRAEVAKSLRLYGDMHRFLPAIASEQGVRIAEVEVNHRPRRHGRSKYGISRTMVVVLDLATVKFLLSYATRPLQIFGLVGLMMGLAGTVITGYLGWVRLFGGQSHRRPSDAAAWDPVGVHRSAAGDARAARRDAGTDVSRVAGKADLLHPRTARDPPRRAGAVAWPAVMTTAFSDRRALAVLVLSGLALGCAVWLLPASHQIVAWRDGSPGRVALLAPLSRLAWVLLASAGLAGGAGWWWRWSGTLAPDPRSPGGSGVAALALGRPVSALASDQGAAGAAARRSVALGGRGARAGGVRGRWRRHETPGCRYPPMAGASLRVCGESRRVHRRRPLREADPRLWWRRTALPRTDSQLAGRPGPAHREQPPKPGLPGVSCWRAADALSGTRPRRRDLLDSLAGVARPPAPSLRPGRTLGRPGDGRVDGGIGGARNVRPGVIDWVTSDRACDLGRGGVHHPVRVAELADLSRRWRPRS